MKLITQKTKYDCGVAAVYNLLQTANIDCDYLELENDLNTTPSWGTFPKHIESLLYEYNKDDFNIGVALVSSEKFYDKDDKDKEDYGHYVNIIGFKNNKYRIFDPWDGLYYDVSEEDLKFMTEDVLVGAQKRFTNIFFGDLEI